MFAPTNILIEATKAHPEDVTNIADDAIPSAAR